MVKAFDRLVEVVLRLPGIGPKMAERIALHLLVSRDSEDVISAINDARSRLVRCEVCGDFTESSPCHRCTDSSRDSSVICIVEEIMDLQAVKKQGF